MDRDDIQTPGNEITEEAASWLLRIREGFSQSEFREWRRWLAEDSAHAEEFDAVRECWQESDPLEDLPWPTNEELDADDYDGSSALPMPRKTSHRTSSRRRSGWRWLATAASIIAVTLVGLGLLRDDAQDFESYETGTAEHRLITLEDGSSITLGAKSDVRISYDSRARRIELRSGEAYFVVAKDRTRPFIVAAGNRTVRALGTEFDINIGVRDIKVSVIEGKVRVDGPSPAVNSTDGSGGAVASLDLESGDVLDFNVADGAGIVSQVDPMLSASWLNGWLAYDGATLESVIADVNRYSEVELIIGDEVTKQLAFTGTIFSDRIDEWLVGFEQVFPLRVVRIEEHGILLIHDER